MTKRVLTIGVPRSGSTWVFNVVLALLKSVSIDHESGFAETDEEYLAIEDDSKPFFVLKAHKLDRKLLERCFGEGWTVIVSARSVGDCVVSQMDMFGVELSEAAHETLNSLASVDEIISIAGLVLRYEDGFPSDERTVQAICSLLGIRPTTETIREVYVNHLSSNLRKDIAEAGVVEVRDGFSKTVEVAGVGSHWYHGHIKDGVIGKFRSRLSSIQLQYLGGLFTSLSVPLVKFPDNILLNRAGICSCACKFYRVASQNGAMRVRLDIGPLVRLPAGNYEIFLISNRLSELSNLNLSTSILADDQIISTFDSEIHDFTNFSIEVPFWIRLEPITVRVEIDFAGWIPRESMVPDAMLIKRVRSI